MGSKSSVVTNVTETVDNSAIDAQAGVRGSNNITQILDGGALEKAFAASNSALSSNNDAIRQAFTFANHNADGTAKSFGDVMGIFGSLADKAFDNAARQSNNALSAVSSSTNSLNSAIQAAQTKLANSGIDPQMIVLGAMALVAFIVFRK